MVWVTAMDDYTVQFDSARYEEIKKAMTAFLKEVGYKLKDIHREFPGILKLLQGAVPVISGYNFHHSMP